MKFRLDIQILRGISVIFVVFFHLGFNAIKSGFLGVDVFFVISGFLMAELYNRENKLDFFKRRAKRLLPAYYTVVASTLIASLIIVSPNEAKQVFSQAEYASIFASNVGFWSQNSYFSKLEFNPLLHLWSLGVEIQFYLIIPMLVWFFRKGKILLPLTIVTSLLLCFAMTGISPKTSFFIMPLRIWEFLVGYGAASYFTKCGSVQIKNKKWIGAIGLFIIAMTPAIKVDGQVTSIVLGHPGLSALLISIATSLVLIFGIPKMIEDSIFGKILSALGKYSYSIYLVHFPIIVLYLSSPFSGTVLTIPTNLDFLIIVALIVCFTALLYYFVESRKFTSSIWKFSAVCTAAITLLTLGAPAFLKMTLAPEEKNIFGAFEDRSTYRCGKLSRILHPGSLSCELTGLGASTTTKMLLVGNSHADSIKTTLADVAKKSNIALYFIVENTPLMKGGSSVSSVIQEAAYRNISEIIVHYSPKSADAKKIKELANEANKVGINVVFIDPVPVWNVHIPKTMYDELKGTAGNLKQTKADYIAHNSLLFKGIENINGENFIRIPVVDYFCTPYCRFKTDDGIPLYYDDGHLTLTGSRILTKVFTQIVSALANERDVSNFHANVR